MLKSYFILYIENISCLRRIQKCKDTFHCPIYTMDNSRQVNKTFLVNVYLCIYLCMYTH